MCGTPSTAPHMRLKHTAWSVPPHNFSHPCLPSIKPRLILLGAIAPTRSLTHSKVQPPKSIIVFGRCPSDPHSYKDRKVWQPHPCQVPLVKLPSWHPPRWQQSPTSHLRLATSVQKATCRWQMPRPSPTPGGSRRPSYPSLRRLGQPSMDLPMLLRRREAMMRRANRSGIHSRLVYVLNNTKFICHDMAVTNADARRRISGSRSHRRCLKSPRRKSNETQPNY